jgi:hypothetical protein
MQLDMLTIQGGFLDNVGPSEALLQLSEHKVEPIVMWIGQSDARNLNQGMLPHGRQMSSMFINREIRCIQHHEQCLA